MQLNLKQYHFLPALHMGDKYLWEFGPQILLFLLSKYFSFLPSFSVYISQLYWSKQCSLLKNYGCIKWIIEKASLLIVPLL